ncbi:MAG: DsbA family protein [Sulfuricaulis sp.]
MSSQRILWYFADPMCSWCWGFAPVISAIKETYAAQMKVALMLGGLRPGATEPMTPESRAEILHHWRDVHSASAQPFAFEGALPEGFVYDTEPAARAVIAVSEIEPQTTFGYFKSVQAAFYAEGQDVTRADVLAALAEGHNIDKPRFLERFESDDARNLTRRHFEMTQETGVRGFPTVVLQNDAGGTLLTNGYRPFAELQPEIEKWLAQPAGEKGQV